MIKKTNRGMTLYRVLSFGFIMATGLGLVGFTLVGLPKATAVDQKNDDLDGVEVAQTSFSKLSLPVTWQMTRARITGPDASTDSEQYFETWTIEKSDAGQFQLVSSRARVDVDVRAKQNSWVRPEKIVMPLAAFAELIGIPVAAGELENEALPVEIDFGAANVHSKVIMNLSEAERLSIQLKLGRP